MTAETHIKGLIHNGRRWDVVRIKDSYFARCYGQVPTDLLVRQFPAIERVAA